MIINPFLENANRDDKTCAFQAMAVVQTPRRRRRCGASSAPAAGHDHRVA